MVPILASSSKTTSLLLAPYSCEARSSESSSGGESSSVGDSEPEAEN